MNPTKAVILLLATLIFNCISFGQVSQKKSPVTNKDVLEMVKAGLSTDVILKFIDGASSVEFDTSSQAIIELKKAGTDDRISTAILERSRLNRSATGPNKGGDKSNIVKARTFTFELKECRLIGATTSCALLITNNSSSEQPLAYYRLAPERVSRVVDDEGNQGNPIEGQIGNMRGDYAQMVPNVGTKATISFDGVSDEAKTLKVLTLWFQTLRQGFIVDSFKVEFKDRPLN